MPHWCWAPGVLGDKRWWQGSRVRPRLTHSHAQIKRKPHQFLRNITPEWITQVMAAVTLDPHWPCIFPPLSFCYTLSFPPTPHSTFSPSLHPPTPPQPFPSQCLQRNRSIWPAGPGTLKTWLAAGLPEVKGRRTLAPSTGSSTNSGMCTPLELHQASNYDKLSPTCCRRQQSVFRINSTASIYWNERVQVKATTWVVTSLSNRVNFLKFIEILQFFLFNFMNYIFSKANIWYASIQNAQLAFNCTK